MSDKYTVVACPDRNPAVQVQTKEGKRVATVHLKYYRAAVKLAERIQAMLESEGVCTCDHEEYCHFEDGTGHVVCRATEKCGCRYPNKSAKS